MRLINTATLTLSQDFFGSQIPEKYAILSHRWREEEPTLQQFELNTAQNLKGYRKIKNAAHIAQERGYDWIWIDTVCIDKTSSAELSEAINSMFRWYLEADICFAYLDDVTGIETLSGSEWFTRGWALQELIAPRNVLFLSQDWKAMQTKWHLAKEINLITGISTEVLQHRVQLSGICVAARMSWASRRITTREEDMAYCLLGIFDVNMPLLYGEGPKSFSRLQEAILQQTGDLSLLAWSPLNPEPEEDLESNNPQYLPVLASSPRCFESCADFEQRIDPGVLTPCTVTRRSVKAVLPIYSLGGTPEIVQAALPCASRDEGFNYRTMIQLGKDSHGQYMRRNMNANTRAIITVRICLLDCLSIIEEGRGWRRLTGLPLLLTLPFLGLFTSEPTEIIILQTPDHVVPRDRGDQRLDQWVEGHYHLPALMALNPLMMYLQRHMDLPWLVSVPAAFLNLFAVLGLEGRESVSGGLMRSRGSLAWRGYLLACGLSFLWYGSVAPAYMIYKDLKGLKVLTQELRM